MSAIGVMALTVAVCPIAIQIADDTFSFGGRLFFKSEEWEPVSLPGHDGTVAYWTRFCVSHETLAFSDGKGGWIPAERAE